MGDLEYIYRDPLFGIAILIAIIAFIILADYYRNFYKKKKKEKSLKTLIRSYEHNGVLEGIAEFLKVSKDPIPTLLFLTKGYVRSGDNQQAIKIYLTLIAQLEDSPQRMEILEEFGAAYLQAGSLQKAKEIYLEVLRNNPYSLQALSKIVQIHEALGEYQDAINALECVLENTDSIDSTQNLSQISIAHDYLRVQILIHNHQTDQDKKDQELLQILHTQEQLTKLILGYFKIYRPDFFWNHLPNEDWEDYIDLLWDFSSEQVPYTILAHSPFLEVFQAKGYYPSQGCSNFALECMRLFSQYSSQKAQLNFAYQCKKCLGEFPFDSFRCPNCNELGKMKLILKPQKIRNENNFSLL